MFLQKSSPEELKILHRLAFNRPGSAGEVKRNLRKFKGLSFGKEDTVQFSKCQKRIEKWVVFELNVLMEHLLRKYQNWFVIPIYMIGPLFVICCCFPFVTDTCYELVIMNNINSDNLFFFATNYGRCILYVRSTDLFNENLCI